ncbi:MAG: UTP--glucose-1-phosphate uridylyltransferase [Leptospiraceae bacterium]|nr:UTP--glucose-1-phosphate uridylyltransferase [Leptospiraceae bacterium]MDW7976708.1 UTP--glucose-1-phosphate uridylyltransferase [Leptospiraceae bacterium]
MIKYSDLNFKNIKNEIEHRMKSKDLHPLIIEDFIKKVHRVYSGESGLMNFQYVEELSQNDLIDLEKLPYQLDYHSELTKEIISRIVLIKLNGGLGTSMGLNKAKTLLKIKDNLTFLDVIIKQIEILRKSTEIEVPLLFMNSFNTHEDTLKYAGIRGINSSRNLPESFIQNQVPRIEQKSLKPIGDGTQNKDWCPPGHGDVYISLKISGILDKLLSMGIEYAFISNGDNLGATFEPSILAYMIDQNLDFISEVTLKTPADIKGGILFRNKLTQRIELLETAQVPPENKKDFEDTTRFKDFNINNLWVNLKSLNKLLQQGQLELSLIVNPKEVDGVSVFQLETAMGSAIGQFPKTKVIRVPRSRFAPVKKCNDLLIKRSDVYEFDEKFALVMNASIKSEPIVKLSREYDHIQDFENYFQFIPSLKECTELTINGKIIFDKPVKLQGKVTLNNENDVPLRISEIYP